MTATLLERAVGSRLVRRTVESLFTHFAKHRTQRVSSLDPADSQTQTLLKLVRRAAHTRFGQEHGFAHIRSLADYQAQVPLRTYEAFWQQYWQPTFPQLTNATWPGSVPYLALSSGTTSGTTKYIPISHEMLASNRRAAFTSLAWFRAQHPQLPLFSGRFFFLGGSTDLTPLGTSGKPVLAGDLSGIAAREVSRLLRPYTYPSLSVALEKNWEEKLRTLVAESATLPITALSGVPSWMLVLFDRLKQATGKQTLSEIWPDLRLIVHGGTSFEPYRSLFQQVVGNDEVQYLETYPASEGFIAAQDPRSGLLRLLLGHGIFFEFVPVDELEKSQPTRHTVHNLVPGVQYAIVLTTCAGLWSYVLGDTVCFEQTSPPLLRFTGRTKYYLSAFGEHLIAEEVEKALSAAAQETGASYVDYHVGPIFADDPQTPGHHRYLIEFVQPPRSLDEFVRALDQKLSALNEDYQAHRVGDLTMTLPEVQLVPTGGFARWMQSVGKFGGQHKLPRMDNSGSLTTKISAWLQVDPQALPTASGG